MSSTSLIDAPAAAPPAVASARPRRRRATLAIWGIVALLLLAAAFPGKIRDVRDRFIPKRWGVVEPGAIYRSGQISDALIRRMLTEHRIARVVDLTFDNPDDVYHEAELAAIAELGIKRSLHPLLADGTGDVAVYATAVKAVADAVRAGQPVLVHCAAGTQRTGGVIAFYRLLVQGREPREVFAEMRRYKYDPVDSPRLLAYLNGNMEAVALELVRSGVIEKVPAPLPVLGAE